MPAKKNRRQLFHAGTLQFLTELAANNERAWFETHRLRYDTDVVAPALEFIAAMGPKIAKISRHFTASPKRMGGSLMRIYRDTRFARDKSPYKTNVGIQFRHERGRDVHAPGFYVHLEPRACFLGAGIWRPDSRALAAIRMEIVDRPKDWQKARDGNRFRKHFELGGDSLARPPRGFPADAPHLMDLRRKDFIAASDVGDRKVVAGEDFVDYVAERFATTAPLMRFLCGALDLKF
jgi:uncharacterized protein (TIGR02453 family)